MLRYFILLNGWYDNYMKFDNEHEMQWAQVIGNWEEVVVSIILSCFNVWSLEIDSNQLLKTYVNVSCGLI